MTETKPAFQPGPIFYEVFTGALRILGTNLKDWAAQHAVHPNNAKQAATGNWNGPKAKLLRDKMVETVGEDLFAKIYDSRMALENRGAA